MFSVILELSTEARGTVCPAFPENLPDLGERLSRGETLFLHEGRPVVAEVVAR